jgi:glycosyltransferase involved in cell wall biosynthesis
MALPEKSICFISPFMGPLLSKSATCGTGGAERQFYIFGTELAKRGWRVVFIADCPVSSDSLPENVSVLHVPFKHLGGSKLSLLTEIPQLLIAILRADTAFYALKTATHIAGVIGLVKVFKSCKLIMWGQTSHSFDRIVPAEPYWVGKIRRWSIRKAEYLVAQTTDQIERALTAFNRSASLIPNITVLDNVVQKTSELVGYIFWCGNYLGNKRAEVILECAKRMPNVQFVMAMNGDEQQARFRDIRANAVAISNMTFLGSVSANEIDAWFADASVYVNTSIREGFPNTFLQAWQQGRPVVSVNIDPTRDMKTLHLGICLDYANDHLTKTTSELSSELAKILDDLIKDGQKLETYEKTCRDYVTRNNSANVVIDQFMAMIGDTSNKNFNSSAQ